MRSALFGASFVAGALAIAYAPPAAAEIVVRIDKETQTMTVTVDRQVLYVWPVSTGMIGRDTPSGTFHPNRMDADHHSQEWDDAPMPNTIFFDMHGHATHGFASITHLGNPASHGCVRLAPPNAAILFDLVKMEKMANSTVIITGTTPSQQAIAKLRLPILAAANAPLTREALTHRSSDQAQPYGKEPAIYIKEAAAYQPAQNTAFEELIPTPTFAMAGAKWQRRAAAIKLAALTAPAPAKVKSPPAEPLPLPHAADREAHEPAMSGRRQAASALVETALNEQPQPVNFEALEPPPQPSEKEKPARAASEQPQPHAADAQPHRPANNGRRQAASGLETAAVGQPAEGEPLEVQARQPKPLEAPAVSQQQAPAYRRQQPYALPPTIPPSAQLPAAYSRQPTPAYGQPYYSRQAGGYGPRYYYVLPPSYGQHVYYYVQPNYAQPGYAQPGYAQPQYYYVPGGQY